MSLWKLLKRLETKLHGFNESKPLVSVIIPTFNSARFLDLCIGSIINQKYDNIEIILVDDGSTDGTIEIAKKHGCEIVINPKKGRAEAKNEGIKHSRGDYLFFVDSDMELTSNVIAECVSLMDNRGLGGVVIPERSVGRSFWVKVRDYERSFYGGTVVESARFFPAWLVREVQGFEEGLVFFEESTLPLKIQKKGYGKFGRIESIIIHHEDDFSIPAWLRKKFYYGKTINIYKLKYRDYSRAQISSYLRFEIFLRDWKRFFRRPTLAFGVIFLKGVEYFAATLGSICARLK